MSSATIRHLGAALLACALACGDPAEHSDAPPEETGHAADDHAPADASVVQIAPEMLRDLRITSAPVEARSAGEGAIVLGDVGVNEEAYAEISLGAPARVIRAFVSPGEKVAAGDALAELESAEIGRARAVAISAQAHAELARRSLARKRELVDEKIAARREQHEAEAAFAAADADLRAARAALSALGIPPGDTGEGARVTLRAPIAGSVLERNLSPGQTSESGQALFRIGELTQLWLSVHAFERDALRVRVGSRARVSFAALPGKSLEGRVTLVGSQVDASSRTVPIRIEIENPDGTLRPGMSASAWLGLGAEGAELLAVPGAAMQRTPEGWCVFLPRGDGRFERRVVGRGRDLGGEVEVLSGLTAGEVVVVDGAFLLKAEVEKTRGGGDRHDH
jgi:cobalt-zinc-cadmium efflux system membrane fusion protein